MNPIKALWRLHKLRQLGDELAVHIINCQFLMGKCETAENENMSDDYKRFLCKQIQITIYRGHFLRGKIYQTMEDK